MLVNIIKVVKCRIYRSDMKSEENLENNIHLLTMKESKVKISLDLIILLCIGIIGYNPIFIGTANGTTIPIHRDHVGVWFNHSDCYHGPHQDNYCSKKELSTMLTVISSKFRTILIDSSSLLPSFSYSNNGTTIPHSAAYWTAGIVAEQNIARGPGPPFTEVIVSFRHTYLEYSLKLAVNIISAYANQIYPGTVSTILLLGGPNGFIGMDKNGNRNHVYPSEDVLKSLKEAKAYMEGEHASYNYRLGVTIHMHECLDTLELEQNKTLVHDLLNYVDTVFVLIGGKFQSLDNEAFAHLHFLGIFYECERNLHKIKNVTVVPFIVPIDERHSSLDDLLRIWGRMSEWAEENNRSVVMYEAVDDYKFVSNDVIMGAMGWWRVETDPKGGPLTEASMVEKIHDLNAIYEDTVCGDHLTVNFELGNESLQYEELTELVTLVATRFTSIMVHHGEPLETLPPKPNSTGILIPRIAAELNRNRSSSVLHVTVTVGFCDIWDSPTLSSFDVAKYMADEANEIYPGTVSTLMFTTSPNWNDGIYLNWSLPILNIAKSRISKRTNKFSYSLGIFLGVGNCGGFRENLHQGFIEEVLPYIDVVAIYTKYNDYIHRSSPDHVLPGVKVEFGDCEEKIKHAKPGIRVVPAIDGNDSSGHPSVSEEGVLNFWNQDYWSQASRWARERGDEVIVFDAFDVPNLNRSTGWWSLEKKEGEKEALLRKSDLKEKFPWIWNCSRTREGLELAKEKKLNWSQGLFYGIGILCAVVIITGVFVWRKMLTRSWANSRYHFSRLTRNSMTSAAKDSPTVIFRK